MFGVISASGWNAFSKTYIHKWARGIGGVARKALNDAKFTFSCICFSTFLNSRQLEDHIGSLTTVGDYISHGWKPIYKCDEPNCQFVAVSGLKLMHHCRVVHRGEAYGTCFLKIERVNEIEKRKRLKKYFIDMQKIFSNRSIMEIASDLCDFGKPFSKQ